MQKKSKLSLEKQGKETFQGKETTWANMPGAGLGYRKPEILLQGCRCREAEGGMLEQGCWRGDAGTERLEQGC